MGYLTQKKRHAREDLFFKITLILWIVMSILSLEPFSVTMFKTWMYQAYTIGIILLLYALVLRRYNYVGTFILLLIVNYFQIESSARIFFDDKVEATSEISFAYNSKQTIAYEEPQAQILNKGFLLFDLNNSASFIKFRQQGRIFTLIKLDLTEYSAKDRQKALSRLEKFVLQQDESVVIFGEFGLPAWNPYMKKFITATGLKVKNHLFALRKNWISGFFAVPDFYILGFDNVGINELDFNPRHNQQLNIKLGFY